MTQPNPNITITLRPIPLPPRFSESEWFIRDVTITVDDGRSFAFPSLIARNGRTDAELEAEVLEAATLRGNEMFPYIPQAPYTPPALPEASTAEEPNP